MREADPAATWAMVNGRGQMIDFLPRTENRMTTTRMQNARGRTLRARAKHWGELILSYGPNLQRTA